MRGLTAAEHCELSYLADPLTHTVQATDEEVGLLDGLVSRGCVTLSEVVIDENYDANFYDIADLGRLALRLWPLNRMGL